MVRLEGFLGSYIKTSVLVWLVLRFFLIEISALDRKRKN